jgi:hypothetical protein
MIEEARDQAIEQLTVLPVNPKDVVEFGVKKIGKTSLIQANRKAGNAFRDELADLLKKDGFDVSLEAYKPTPFGGRYIDIEISKGGSVLGGIEAKVGRSPYKPSQRIKDFYLSAVKEYPVILIRRPPNW